MARSHDGSVPDPSDTPNPEPRRAPRPSGRNVPPPPPDYVEGYTHVDVGGPSDALPDILNAHLPPPYSTLPPGADRVRRLPPPPHPPPSPPTHPAAPPSPPCPPRSLRGPGGFRRFPSRGRARSFGRGSTGCGSGSHPAASESDEPKHCCGVMVTQTVSIRWFIVMIAFVGLCCAIVGTVLGALKATGREHLTVSLLMIGVGIVLITVSGIAWRLTSRDAPSCRAMLGLHTDAQEPNRRFVPRVPPYGRPHHPYAAMMYPEFQYRPPPPSYQASMQEYRLRLLLLDRQQGALSTSLSPVSPPPTYRSHVGSMLHTRLPINFTERDYSRPPSYRSRASSGGALRPGPEVLDSRHFQQQPQPQTCLQPQPPVPDGGRRSAAGPSPSHSRDPSLSLSFLSHELLFTDSATNLSRQTDPGRACASDNTNPPQFTSPSGESWTSVVHGLSDESPSAGGTSFSEGDGTVPRPPSSGTSAEPPPRGRNHDVNTVTIVQTTDSSQVLNQDTVIVSVLGQNGTPSPAGSSLATAGLRHGEVQILAHV